MLDDEYCAQLHKMSPFPSVKRLKSLEKLKSELEECGEESKKQDMNVTKRVDGFRALPFRSDLNRPRTVEYLVAIPKLGESLG
jgi:hypothetical protein